VQSSAIAGTVGDMKPILLVHAVAVVLVSAFSTAAAGADPGPRLLAEDSGPAPAASCTEYDCATVLSIRRTHALEPVDAESDPGLYFGVEEDELLDPDDPYDPYDPVLSSESAVEKASDLWYIEVATNDGDTQTFRQDFPPLFHPGDRVVVEGDRLRLADTP
jgi:hypothetical protein